MVLGTNVVGGLRLSESVVFIIEHDSKIVKNGWDRINNEC